jgi:predicted SprT family Zn-dependent metalloprotease
MKPPVPTLQLSLPEMSKSPAVSPLEALQPLEPLQPPESRVPGTDRAGQVMADEDLRHALELRLRVNMGPAVKLTITDNRRTMVSVRRRAGVRHVRLHHMFADAPAEIIHAVSHYLIQGDRNSSKLIDRYIAANQSRIRVRSSTEPVRLEPRGKIYNLEEIQRALSERYFSGTIQLNITWGRHGTSHHKRNARRTIRMGTYFIDEQLIRIHPALDQSFVPRYFVEWVVYHEMLHHVIPMPVVNGRRIYHSPEFRRYERFFVDYERARAWEQTHLRKLIGSRNVAATT